MAPQAFGQLGNCYLDDALIHTNADAKAISLNTASNMFQAVLDLGTKADVTARGQAQFGLGLVAKYRDQPDEELSCYLQVVLGEPKDSDPFWVEQAGVAASQLLEAGEKWDQAINVYTRVKQAVPSLTAEMDKRIEAARAKRAGSGH